MKIAQIGPLQESVPPKTYGGTERVISYLTEALISQGHEVTLFASGDSNTSGKLVPCCRQGLRFEKSVVDENAYHTLMMEEVFRQAEDFDVIHNHNDYLLYPLARRWKTPTVTTLHGRLDLPYLSNIYQEFHDMPIISISEQQRGPLPNACWVDNIHHGLPKDLYAFQEKSGNYLAFLGRMSPEKGIETAINIAKEAGMPLKIAAKVNWFEQEYFTTVIEPLLKHPLIEYIGEIRENEKSEFLGNAKALLFPIKWPEPFGLVMIESMACGTPVIATRYGSVSEVMEDGVTGFIVENQAQAVQALKKINQIERSKCREVFETRFSDDRMARDYINIYQQLLSKEQLHAY